MNRFQFTERLQYIQQFKQLNQEAQQELGTSPPVINVVYDPRIRICPAMMGGYTEEELTQDVAKLNDGSNKSSHFQKLAKIIHRFIKKLTRDSIALQTGSKAFILPENEKQYVWNKTKILNLIKKQIAKEYTLSNIKEQRIEARK
ncbi:hypothetical protein ABPG72_005900 [Tetrahymena utriculariae]